MRDLDKIRDVVEQAALVYESDGPAEALQLLSDIHFEDEDKEDALYARFLCVRGSAQAELGEIEAATASFEEALEYHRIRNESSKIGLIHFNLGNVCKYAHRNEQAIENYRKAIDSFEEANNPTMMVVAYLALGNLVANEGNWDEARESLLKTTALVPDDELPPDLLWSKRSLQVKLAIIDEDEELTVTLGRQAVAAAGQSGVASYEAESLLILSESLARGGETREAHRYALQAREVLTGKSGTSARELRRSAQAALMKIDNLDLAFGVQSDHVEVSPRQFRATAPADLDIESLTFMIAQDVAKDKPKFLDSLTEVSNTQKLGQLCVFSNFDALLYLIDGAEVIAVDACDAATWDRLEQDWTVSTRGRQTLMHVAVQLCRLGVELKASGHIEAALLHYCLALRLAIRFRLIEGLDAITGNIFRLAKQFVTQIQHSSRPLITGPNEAGLTFTGGNILVAPGSDDEEDSKRLLDFCRVEASSALTSIEAWTQTTEDPMLQLLKLRSLRRLRSLSGERGQSTLIANISRLGTLTGEATLVLESIYEELADTDFMEMLKYLGLLEPDSESEENLQSTWELYRAWRSRLGQIEPLKLRSAAQLALDEFEMLRATSVAAGGSFGHRISYDTVQFPARISRDVIRMLIKGDKRQQLEALWLAEGTCSRALVDWMGRTHPNNRLMIRKGITRSVGQIQCASVAEIFSAAEQNQTALLYYVSVIDGYVLWAIYPNGDWECTHIEGIAPELLKLFKALPYTLGTPKLGRARSSAQTAVSNEQPVSIDQLLLDLGTRLLPESVREKMVAESPKRIAIVADQLMQFVPFACLKFDESSYVVDHFDIVHWPSVTAWLLCCQAESLYAKNSDNALPSLVMGGPDFSAPLPIVYRGFEQHITPEDLPGARQEAANIAKLLEVEPRILSDASFAAILEHYFEYDKTQHDTGIRPFVPVMHLATHGLTDTWDPNQSLVAFADRLLTAQFLYELDAGLLTRLVMLSCCQTAVGYTHPDSIIGLANAFLVAGACTVGSTLWNVDDEATSTLMSHFYVEIKNGKDVSSAIRSAQNHLRSFPAWSHPYYWAPFKVTGSFSNPLDRVATD